MKKEISNKNQNWVIFIVTIVLVVLVAHPISKEFATAMDEEYPLSASKMSWAFGYCLVLIMTTVAIIGICNVLIPTLGPDICIDERINGAKKQVDRWNSLLRDAEKELDDLKNEKEQRNRK